MKQSEIIANKLSKSVTFGGRAQLCSNKTARQLFDLMERKKTNLAVSADVTTKAELIKLIHAVGSEICVLKTHIDIIIDFDRTLLDELTQLAYQYDFLLFEDRKFADIGNTVKHQYKDGLYTIADWADITNAHTITGPGIVQGLQEVGLKKGRGLLLVAQMSSKGNHATGTYTHEAVELAKQYADFIIGFIAMEKLTDDPRFVHMTPGVKLQSGVDALGQQYKTPELVIGEKECDVIIVGRGIYKAEDPRTQAQQYRMAAWRAYEKRLEK